MATSRHETRFELTATDKTRAAIKSAEVGFKQLDGVVSKLALGVTSLAGVGGIGMLITSQVNAARESKAWADALGVPIERLTAMQSAAEVAGLGGEKLVDILKDTAEKIADAYRNGGGEAVEVLNSLGLNIAEINALSPDQQLFRIAEALGQVGTQGEKIQIMEALSSDASKLLPLLDDNAAKLRELMQAADESGRTLTGIEADKLVEAGAAMRQLKESSEGLQQTLAVTLGPELANIANWFSVMLPQAIGTGSDWLDQFRIAALTMYADVAETFSHENNEIIKSVRATVQVLTDELIMGQEQLKNFSPAGLNVGELPQGGGFESGAQSDEEAKQEAALERLRQSLLSKEEVLMEAHLREIDMIDQAETSKIDTIMSYDEMRMASALKLESGLTQITQQEAARRARIEERAQGQIASFKQKGLAIGVGLLRTLGQEHEGFAYAAIALEKALAIGQINIEASKAHMAAYNLLTLGSLGPMAVSAMHTQIEASRAFAIGMTVASGLVEAAGVGGGGGGGIGGAIPVTPVQSPTNLAPVENPSAPAQGNQLTILVKGDGKFTDLVRDSIEILDSNDELVLING